jgi:hypothetical protein
MRTKCSKLWYLGIGLVVLLALATPVAMGESLTFYRLNDTGSGWEESGGKYVVYKVGLHTVLSQLTYYQSLSTDCGTAAHEVTTDTWPYHIHVLRSNDSSSPWVTSKMPDWHQGTKPETKKFYEVMILNNGGDPKAPVCRDDGQDTDCQHGDPNFKTNCYSYAFYETGLEDYNDAVIIDGDNGAKLIRNTLYNQIAGPSDTRKTIMWLDNPGELRHANWVRIANEGCKIECMKFKFQPSQVFEYDYDSPGRSKSTDFWDLADPSYWSME